MKKLRSIARWGSLLGMIVGAAVSVGVSALIAACSSDSETGDGKPGGDDAGAVDAGADAEDASDATGDSLSPNLDAPTPTDDVSLDSIPAE